MRNLWIFFLATWASMKDNAIQGMSKGILQHQEEYPEECWNQDEALFLTAHDVKSYWSKVVELDSPFHIDSGPLSMKATLRFRSCSASFCNLVRRTLAMNLPTMLRREIPWSYTVWGMPSFPGALPGFNCLTVCTSSSIVGSASSKAHPVEEGYTGI